MCPASIHFTVPTKATGRLNSRESLRERHGGGIFVTETTVTVTDGPHSMMNGPIMSVMPMANDSEIELDTFKVDHGQASISRSES